MPRALVLQKKSIRGSFMSSRFSHLRAHESKDNFQNTLNPPCIYGKTLKQRLIIFPTITISPMKEALS